MVKVKKSDQTVQVVKDIYEPLSVSDVELNPKALPKIKYFKGLVGYLPVEEARQYIADGSMIPSSKAKVKKFKDLLIAALKEKPHLKP